MNNNLIEILPLWGLFIAALLVISAALLTGFFWGSRTADKDDTASVPPMSAVVTSMLALLAFLLALAFNSASTRHEVRTSLLLEDANAIGSVYLRADFLFPDDRDETRRLLKRYVELRLRAPQELNKLQENINQTEKLQLQLWAIAARYSQSKSTLDLHPVIVGRYIDTLNEMFDINHKRLTYAVQYRIHPTIWYSLLGVGVVSLGALGFQFGASGGKRYQISLLLALCFCSILLLILDLDRPTEGLVRINQMPLLMLQKSMNSTPHDL